MEVQLDNHAMLPCLIPDEVLAILGDNNEQRNEQEEEQEGDEEVMAKRLQEEEQDNIELSELQDALNWCAAILVEKKHLEKRWADKVGA